MRTQLDPEKEGYLSMDFDGHDMNQGETECHNDSESSRKYFHHWNYLNNGWLGDETYVYTNQLIGDQLLVQVLLKSVIAIYFQTHPFCCKYCAHFQLHLVNVKENASALCQLHHFACWND